MTAIRICDRCRAGVVVEAACANCGVRTSERGISAREFAEINRRIARALADDGDSSLADHPPGRGPRWFRAAVGCILGVVIFAAMASGAAALVLILKSLWRLL